MADRALDIFSLFNNIDRKDKFIWSKLTDEQKKEYSALVSTRWLSGCDDKRQIIFLNTLVNPMLFVNGDHRELMMKLQAICGSGRTKRYQWIGIKAKADKKSPLAIRALSELFGYSSKVAADYVDRFSQDDYVSTAEQLGWQQQEIKDLKKQVKK
jgi:hypothetical protein